MSDYSSMMMGTPPSPPSVSDFDSSEWVHHTFPYSYYTRAPRRLSRTSSSSTSSNQSQDRHLQNVHLATSEYESPNEIEGELRIELQPGRKSCFMLEDEEGEEGVSKQQLLWSRPSTREDRSGTTVLDDESDDEEEEDESDLGSLYPLYPYSRRSSSDDSCSSDLSSSSLPLLSTHTTLPNALNIFSTAPTDPLQSDYQVWLKEYMEEEEESFINHASRIFAYDRERGTWVDPFAPVEDDEGRCAINDIEDFMAGAPGWSDGDGGRGVESQAGFRPRLRPISPFEMGWERSDSFHVSGYHEQSDDDHQHHVSSGEKPSAPLLLRISQRRDKAPQLSSLSSIVLPLVLSPVSPLSTSWLMDKEFGRDDDAVSAMSLESSRAILGSSGGHSCFNPLQISPTHHCHHRPSSNSDLRTFSGEKHYSPTSGLELGSSSIVDSIPSPSPLILRKRRKGIEGLFWPVLDISSSSSTQTTSLVSHTPPRLVVRGGVNLTQFSGARHYEPTPGLRLVEDRRRIRVSADVDVLLSPAPLRVKRKDGIQDLLFPKTMIAPPPRLNREGSSMSSADILTAFAMFSTSSSSSSPLPPPSTTTSSSPALTNIPISKQADRDRLEGFPFLVDRQKSEFAARVQENRALLDLQEKRRRRAEMEDVPCTRTSTTATRVKRAKKRGFGWLLRCFGKISGRK